MKKLLHILAWVVIFGNMFILGIICFWLLYPYNPADIKVPIQILNTDHKITVGEPIKMRIILNKYSDVKPVVVRYVTCNTGNTADFAGAAAIRPVGTYNYVVDNFILPPKFKDGEVCRFNYKNYYKVNPIRTIVKDWYSEEFTVVGGE